MISDRHNYSNCQLKQALGSCALEAPLLRVFKPETQASNAFRHSKDKHRKAKLQLDESQH